jgi:hypothetical protein
VKEGALNVRTLQRGFALMLVVIATGCVDPKDRRPGLLLRGEVVESAIDDWSFSDAFQEVYLETATWYLVPHSVTTVCAGIGDKLYVPSLYYAGGAWPNKYWNENVASDPRVRVEMGDKIYEREAVVVENPQEFQAALEALAAKYPFWRDMLAKPESERPDMAIVRLDPRRS